MKEVQNRKFALYAWGVVIYNLLVAIWGAYVRATGSGAGCGEHWPTCNGEVIPRAARLETIIEYSHRLTSGLALVSVVVLLIWAYRAYEKGHKVLFKVIFTLGTEAVLLIGAYLAYEKGLKILTGAILSLVIILPLSILLIWAYRTFQKGHKVLFGAILSLFFIITEAALGASLVLLRLVADDVSMARVAAMGVHLVNTLFLFGAMALTAWWAQGGKMPQLNSNIKVKRLMSGILLLLIFVGVSGAITALGDTLFHPDTIQAMTGQEPFAEKFLRELRFLHPVLAVGVAMLMISLAINLRGIEDTHTLFWSKWAIILCVMQLIAGTFNIILKVPVWLQMVHLLLAYGVWISALLMGSSALSANLPELED